MARAAKDYRLSAIFTASKQISGQFCWVYLSVIESIEGGCGAARGVLCLQATWVPAFSLLVLGLRMFCSATIQFVAPPHG